MTRCAPVVSLIFAVALATAACRPHQPPPAAALQPEDDAPRCIELETFARHVHEARRGLAPLDPELAGCLAALPDAGTLRGVEEALALALDGELGALQRVRHALAVREGSFGLAVQRLERAAATEPGAALEVALWRLRARDLDGALAAVRLAASLAPDDPAPVLLELELEQRRGAPASALRAWLAPRLAMLPEGDAWSAQLAVAPADGLARHALLAALVASSVAEVAARPRAVRPRARLAALLAEQPWQWEAALATLAGPDGATDSIELTTRQVRLLLRTGDDEAALVLARALLTAHPGEPDLLDLWVDLCQRLRLDEERERAETRRLEVLRTRARNLSDDPSLQIALARELLSAAALAEAISALQHAERLAPGDTLAPTLLGHALRMADDDDEAELAFRRALATLEARLAEAPERVSIAAEQANLLLDGLRAPEAALAAIDGVRAMEAGDRALLQYARCRALEQLDEGSAARAACEAAVVSAPAWSAPRKRLVEVAPDDRSRIEALRALLALVPEDGLARQRLAQLLVTAREPAEAARLLVEPLAWPGANLDALEVALSRLEHRGMPGLALWLRRTSPAMLHSSVPLHWRALARTAMTLGEWAVARRAASQVVRLGGGALALVWLAERQVVDGAGASQVAATLSELVALRPQSAGVDFLRLAQLARTNGLPGIGAWAECRIRDGVACGAPPVP